MDVDKESSLFQACFLQKQMIRFCSFAFFFPCTSNFIKYFENNGLVVVSFPAWFQTWSMHRITSTVCWEEGGMRHSVGGSSHDQSGISSVWEQGMRKGRRILAGPSQGRGRCRESARGAGTRRCWQGSEAVGHSRAEALEWWESSRDALDPLPDKREETQGPQDAIERDVGDEVAQVVADGPGQVLGDRENTRYHFAHLG